MLYAITACKDLLTSFWVIKNMELITSFGFVALFLSMSFSASGIYYSFELDDVLD